MPGGTRVRLDMHPRQVGQALEALALAQVHARTCMGLTARRQCAELAEVTQTLALALGEAMESTSAHPMWREWLSDHVLAYASALWRARRGE